MTGPDPELLADFRATFAGLAAIGRDQATGGWRRFALTDSERAARAWFWRQADGRGLAAERDRNGNLWAWWGDPAGGGALVLGSHLDTVAQGGAYDGALGVVAGFVALGALRRRGVAPTRPVAVAAFAEEEGGRFGLPTLGSRLLAGTVEPGVALTRTDVDGVTLAEAAAADGLDPDGIGPDPERLAGLAAAVELHVEQGRGLVDLDAPLAVAAGIWAHGRWRLGLRGEVNHAGTTRLADRRDPMLPFARAVAAARELATSAGAVATVGRVLVEPNGTNSVPGAVAAWLDARAPDDATLDGLVAAWLDEVAHEAEAHGVEAGLTPESRSAGVTFDAGLRATLRDVLRGMGLPAPELPTAAGHDAGALAAAVPTAMLFVRNPTGASHSPAEFAGDEDCALGCAALAGVVEALACR
jgi:N-carbamoyl-L-amino-acid hydrolase